MFCKVGDQYLRISSKDAFLCCLGTCSKDPELQKAYVLCCRSAARNKLHPERKVDQEVDHTGRPILSCLPPKLCPQAPSLMGACPPFKGSHHCDLPRALVHKAEVPTTLPHTSLSKLCRALEEYEQTCSWRHDLAVRRATQKGVPWQMRWKGQLLQGAAAAECHTVNLLHRMGNSQAGKSAARIECEAAD